MEHKQKHRFDLYIRHEVLVQKARTTLRSAVEGSQVSQRMRRLLPNVLHDRKRHYLHSNFSSAKSDRLAHIDAEYEDFVSRYIEARSKALYDRVMADSYFRLIAARQSLRFFREKDRFSKTKNPK